MMCNLTICVKRHMDERQCTYPTDKRIEMKISISTLESMRSVYSFPLTILARRTHVYAHPSVHTYYTYIYTCQYLRIRFYIIYNYLRSPPFHSGSLPPPQT